MKSSRQIDADDAAVRRALYGRGSRINGAKSCILGLSWHLISLLKLHFFVLFFSYFQQLFKIKDPPFFFTTFDYIVAVIQALQFVDNKDVSRFYFFNAI